MEIHFGEVALSLSRIWKPFLIALAALIFIVSILLFKKVPEQFTRAIAFLSDIQQQPAPEWARQMDFRFRQEETSIAAASLRARVYRPLGVPKTAGVVLIPGLHPKGIDDVRFKTLAEALARQGFSVLAPDI